METSDRPAIKRKARDVIKAAFAAAETEDTPDPDLVGWTVHYSWPGDEGGDRRIILGNTTGDEAQTAFGGPQMPRQDKFILPLLVEVRGEIGGEGESDDERGDTVCQKALDLIDAALFDAPRLSPLNVTATPGAKDGPNPHRGDPSGAYLLSFATRDIQVTCTVPA